MISHDLDSLLLLARQQHEQRLREADAERLARVLRGTAQKRRWLRLSAATTLAIGRRANQQRLEA
jgi:hypothetical protein